MSANTLGRLNRVPLREAWASEASDFTPWLAQPDNLELLGEAVEMRLEPDGRIPQDVFFLIKETTGVGDFVGTAGRPTPMKDHEIEKMLKDSKKPEDTPNVRMVFEKGEHVIIKEGPFQSYEGTVDELLPEKGVVRVLVTIFGRPTPVELEFVQVQKL